MIAGVDLSSLLVSDILSREFRESLYQRFDTIEADEIHFALDTDDTIYNRTLERYVEMYGTGIIHDRTSHHEEGTATEKLLRVKGMGTIYHGGPKRKGNFISWWPNNPPTSLTAFDYCYPVIWPLGKGKTYNLDSDAPSWKYTPLLNWIFDENGWVPTKGHADYATKSSLSAVDFWVTGVPRDKASTALITLSSPYHIPTMIPGVLDFDEKGNDPEKPDKWIVKPASAYIMKSNRIIEGSCRTIQDDEIMQPIISSMTYEGVPVSFRTYVLITSLKGRYRGWVSHRGYGQFSLGEIVTNVGSRRRFSLPLFEKYRYDLTDATIWLVKRLLNVVKYHTPQKKPGYVLLGVDTLIDQGGQVRIIEVNYSPAMILEFKGQEVIAEPGVSGPRVGNIGYQILSCLPAVVEYLVDETDLTFLNNWDYVGETTFTIDPEHQVYYTPVVVNGKRRAFIPDVDDIQSMLPGLPPRKIEKMLSQITIIDRSGFPIGMIHKGKRYDLPPGKPVTPRPEKASPKVTSYLRRGTEEDVQEVCDYMMNTPKVRQWTPWNDCETVRSTINCPYSWIVDSNIGVLGYIEFYHSYPEHAVIKLFDDYDPEHDYFIAVHVHNQSVEVIAEGLTRLQGEDPLAKRVIASVESSNRMLVETFMFIKWRLVAITTTKRDGKLWNITVFEKKL